MTATAPHYAPPVERLRVASRLFGPIDVPAEACLTFPNGLLGFAGERRFVLLPAAAEGIYWLQCVEDGGLTFLLVDPFPIFPGYAVDVPDHWTDRRPVPPLVLAIVTLARGDEPCTANLQAPLVLDLATRTGRQLILGDERYSVREPFDLRARLLQPSPRGR